MRRSALHRAYALPLCLMLSGILAAAFAVYVTRLKSAVSTTTLSVARRQVFYVADAVARAATEVASAKLSTMPPVDATQTPAQQAAFFVMQTAQLQAELDSKQSIITPDDYLVRNMTISDLGTRTQQTLRSGPFKGMNAQVQPFTIAVEVTKAGGNQAVASMQSSIDRATLSMFQFFAFIDGYAFIFNGPGAKFAGRMHSNGNMCIGAGSTTYMERLTSGGNIYKLKGSGCRNETSGGGASVYVSRIDLANGIASFPPGGNGSDFKDAYATALADSGTWINDAAAWAGHVTDKTHGVPVLKAPITGAPRAQRGRNALGALTDNSGNSRFLIDPVLKGEASDVQQQKIAWKADLRIIDGIWYLRDADRPTELGKPIWSDRPGKTATLPEERWAENVISVGQDDLFGSNPRPQRYSYYRTATSGSSMLATPTSAVATAPVVSYGVLKRDATNPRWTPGFYSQGGDTCSTGNCWDVQAATTPAQFLQGTRSGFRSAWDESGVTAGADDCGAGVNRRANLGFTMTDARGSRLFNTLPLNFDVDALQRALLDTSTGELGAIFAGRGKPFNGIIFISATWPGSGDGYGISGPADRATFWPPQGLQHDDISGLIGTGRAFNAQPTDRSGVDAVAHPLGYGSIVTMPIEGPTTTTDAVTTAAPPFHVALPKVFCSDDTALTAGPRRVLATFMATTTPNFSGTVPATNPANDINARAFHAPLCERYRTATSAAPTKILRANYNAVRIINAANLSKTTLPVGLSIVTNLPMFLLGDVNSSSSPADKPSQVVSTSSSSADEKAKTAAWVPFMLGGDTIGLLSNNWIDDNAPWNVSVARYYGKRQPSSTTFHGQFLYGWAEPARNGSGTGCRDELTYSMRLHEDWSKDTSLQRTVRGAIFVGWNSVFGMPFSNVHESGAWHDGAGDKKIYGFDLRLDVLTNQPPGAPQFQVAATQTFRRN